MSRLLNEIRKIVKEAKKLPYYPNLDPWKGDGKQHVNLTIKFPHSPMKKRD